MAYTLGNKCAKIVVNGQFQFNLSSKTWSHVFGTQCMYKILLKSVQWVCRCGWSKIVLSRYFGHWLK